MTTVGAGYNPAVWADRGNPAAPLLCACCTVSTGTGNFTIYRSWDQGATWDTGITVATLVDGVLTPLEVTAQRPALAGTTDRITLAYQGTGIETVVSADMGGTWA